MRCRCPRGLPLATSVAVAVTLLQAALHCQATTEGADAPGAIQMIPVFVASKSTGEILSAPVVAAKQGYVVVVAVSTTGQSSQILRRKSVDGGKTFNATDRVCVGCVKPESSLILLGERESADFLLVFLDSTGSPSVARSHNNGETWLPATRMDLDAPWIPGTARCQLASGLIVLGGKSPVGAPLIATSANLGISWTVTSASSMLGAVFALPASGTTRFASPQPCAGPSCPFGTAHGTLQLPATRWGNAVFAAKAGNNSRHLNILVSTDDAKSFDVIEQTVTSEEVSSIDLTVLPLASNRTGCLIDDVLASGCGADDHLLRVLVVAGSPNDVSIAMLPPQHDLCPAGCSGHGACVQASCECETGWAPPDCSNRTTNDHSFLELTHEYASAAPNNATTVTNGNVRVQLLTEDLARLEYSPTAEFVDAPSVAVLKRAWPSVEHKVETLDGWLSITTSGLKIEYNIAAPGPFNRNNTRVTVRHDGKDSMTWRPDQSDNHNLGGIPQFPYDMAIYDPLDHGETNTTGQDGLLSRAGYTVLDDSFTPIYNSAADWIAARPGVVASPNSSVCAVSLSDRSECAPQLGLGRDCTNGPNKTCGNPPNPSFCASMGCCYDPSQTPMCYFSQLAPRDMFFFGYGGSDQPNYKKALQLASALLGPPPLPPKHALGVWVGDRAGYSMEEWRSIVQRYREEELPIDMIVLDSDSSTKATWSRGSWDTEQLPDPAGMWQWLHSEHVVATVNEHFAAIDRDTTHQFEAIRQRVGLPSGTAAINHDLANKAYAVVWAEQLHLDDLRQGLGFWWEDGNAGANMVGLDAMTWTRHVEYALHTELARTGSALRPWTFCRGGSWGSHRYGSVFTGDLSSAWDKLLQVVIVSIRSGNALVPYLANDDLGVMGPEALSDNEYHRWIQFASLSAHYWTHPMWGDRFPYDYGDAGLRVFRKFLELRMHLMPYMYSLAHEAHTTGLSLLRGMYIEFPQHSESYIPCTGIDCTHVGVNATTYGAASSVGGLISNGGFEAVTADAGQMVPKGWVPYLSGSKTQSISRAVVHSGNYAAELTFNQGPEGLLAILQNCGPATTPSCEGAFIQTDVSYEYSFWAYCTLAPCTFRTEWLTQPQGKAQTFPLLASDSNPTKFHTVADPHVWTRFSHQVTSAADQGAVVIDLGLCSSSGCTPAANPAGVTAYVDDIILAEVSCSTNQCQYMLGPSLLVAPVTDTLPEDGSFNVKTVWLPPGSEWYDFFQPGRVFAGNQTLSYTAPLDTLPLFVKGGSILPMARSTESTGHQSGELSSIILDIYAGSTPSSFVWYEDDGNTTDYELGKFLTTAIKVSLAEAAGTSTAILVAAAAGSGYAGAPTTRHYEMRLHGFPLPASVTANGQLLKEGPSGWLFAKRTGIITIWATGSVAAPLTVSLNGTSQQHAATLRKVRRCRTAVRDANKQVRALWSTVLAGQDMGKPPRLLRQLEQLERELTATLTSSAEPREDWGARIVAEFVETGPYSTECVSLRCRSSHCHLTTRLGAGGADHAMEAVRFMPGPPDNPWGAAATGLYQAEVPKDVVRELAGSLRKNC